MTANIDAPNLLTGDLWVDPDKWEILTKDEGIEELADDDTSAISEETEESSYEDDESEYEEDEDEYKEDEYKLISEDSTEDRESE